MHDYSIFSIQHHIDSKILCIDIDSDQHRRDKTRRLIVYAAFNAINEYGCCYSSPA